MSEDNIADTAKKKSTQAIADDLKILLRDKKDDDATEPSNNDKPDHNLVNKITNILQKHKKNKLRPNKHNSSVIKGSPRDRKNKGLNLAAQETQGLPIESRKRDVLKGNVTSRTKNSTCECNDLIHHKRIHVR